RSILYHRFSLSFNAAIARSLSQHAIAFPTLSSTSVLTAINIILTTLLRHDTPGNANRIM
ncbi:TPA: hypothetical protein ACPY4Y_004183, partial [Yersinia enterocolitica]